MKIKLKKGVSEGNLEKLAAQDKIFFENLTNLPEKTYSIFKEAEFIGIISIIRKVGEGVHIGNFYIDKNYRGQGYATEALESFVKLIFSAKNIKTITLNVLADNEVAIKLYKKCNFKMLATTNTTKKYLMYRKG